MNGIDATKKIRKYLQSKKDAQRPVIIGVTGHVLDAFQEQGTQAGMDTILSKPLHAQTLKGVV